MNIGEKFPFSKSLSEPSLVLSKINMLRFTGEIDEGNFRIEFLPTQLTTIRGKRKQPYFGRCVTRGAGNPGRDEGSRD